jgi:hypothetical protein
MNMVKEITSLTHVIGQASLLEFQVFQIGVSNQKVPLNDNRKKNPLGF